MNKSSEWSYITSVYIRVLRGSTQCLFFSSFFFIRFFFVSLESDQHANSSSYREKKRIRWTTVFPVNESKKQTNRNQTKNENTEHYLSEKERTSRYTCWHCRMHINRFSNIFFSLFFHLQMYICFSFFFFGILILQHEQSDTISHCIECVCVHFQCPKLFLSNRT